MEKHANNNLCKKRIVYKFEHNLINVISKTVVVRMDLTGST